MATDIKNLIKNPGHGMIIDGIVGGAQIDSSGEILDVEGADISSLRDGDGVLNWEHKGSDQGSPRDIVGKCIFAKKIFKESDCEDERQKTFFAESKGIPIIYAKFRLFDGSGHLDAMACAAQIRDMYHAGEKIVARYSVEGSTIEKKGNVLKRSIIRAIALTLKPCNKFSNSSIVEDPSWPLDGNPDNTNPLEFLEETTKFEHPGYTKLYAFDNTIAPIVEDPVSKALEAGNYNAAPGSLTGGAALQREDLGRAYYVSQAKSALRDYDWQRKEAGKDDFKKFLKNRMPEADSSFIDYFADMVDDYRVGKKAMKKGEDSETLPLTAGLMESIRTHSYHGKRAIRYIVPENMHPRIRGSHKNLTTFGMVHGKDEAGNIVPFPTKDSESYFDKEFGYLHTPRGSFKVNIPGDDFEDVMKLPEIQKVHDNVSKNWRAVNRLMENNKLPPELIACTSFFASAPPAVAIPFETPEIDPNLMNGVNEYLDTHSEPEGSDESCKFHVGLASELANSNGDARSIANKYHLTKEDNVTKRKLDRESAERAAVKEGLGIVSDDGQVYLSQAGHEFVDENGPFEHEGMVSHNSPFAPKTVRYSIGCLGGGNILVPDQHLIRHLFGLPQDKDVVLATQEMLGRPLKNSQSYAEKVFEPNAYLKKILWDSGDNKLLDDIAKYYIDNHPAYKYTANRFWGGNVSAKQALLLSSWMHWLAIPKHEAKYGMRDGEFSGGTEHGTYWHHVRSILSSHGLDKLGVRKSEGQSMASRVAAAHNDMYDALGPTAASIFYFHQLVPHVLNEACSNGHYEDTDGICSSPTTNEPEASVIKMEVALLSLSKMLNSIEKLHKADQSPTEETMIWGGKHIRPGKATKWVRDSNTGEATAHPMEVVESGPNHYYLSNRRFDGNRSYSKVTKDRMKEFGIEVHSEPELLDTNAVVDSLQHTPPEVTMFPEQHELVHGMTFEDNVAKTGGPASLNQDTSKWGKNASGQHVFIKGTNDEIDSTFPLARREAAYYNMARDFFGMHKYVPVATAVRHPKSGKEVAVIAGIPNAIHPRVGKDDQGVFLDEEQQGHINDLGDSGELDKMAIMNAVLGNTDRHQHNIMFGGDRGQLHLIDHDNAFPRGTIFSAITPAYYSAYAKGKYPSRSTMDGLSSMSVHPEAQKWLSKLSVTDLGQKLSKQGVPMNHVEAAMRNLAAIKSLLEKHPNASKWDVLQVGFHPIDGFNSGMSEWAAGDSF